MQQCKQRTLTSRANPVHCPSSMESSTNTRTHGPYIDHSLPDVLFDVYVQYVQHCKAQQNNPNKTTSPAMQLHWDRFEKRLQHTEIELCSITHIELQPAHVRVLTRDEAHLSKTTRCLVEKACARFFENKFYSPQENSARPNAGNS